MADFLSSGKFLPSEWTLNPLFVCFQRFCQVIVPRPEIDLFASTLNLQFPKFSARCRVFQAWKVVALSFRWSGLPLFAFPPFSILPSVLEEIAQEGSDIMALRPQRPWFLKLLSILAGHPRALPLLKDLCLPTLVSSTIFLWCNDILVTPFSDSLGQVADFLLFLFDKGLAFSSFRGYRSSIASCFRGFSGWILYFGVSILFQVV